MISEVAFIVDIWAQMTFPRIVPCNDPRRSHCCVSCPGRLRCSQVTISPAASHTAASSSSSRTRWHQLLFLLFSGSSLRGPSIRSWFIRGKSSLYERCWRVLFAWSRCRLFIGSWLDFPPFYHHPSVCVCVCSGRLWSGGQGITGTRTRNRSVYHVLCSVKYGWKIFWPFWKNELFKKTNTKKLLGT